jgi:hypothetical protein
MAGLEDSSFSISAREQRSSTLAALEILVILSSTLRVLALVRD